MTKYYDASGNEIDTIYDENGKAVSIEGPANLRAELKAAKSQAEALQKERDDLAAEARQGKIKTALDGFPEKARLLVEETGVDPVEFAEKYGDLFGVTKPAEGQTQEQTQATSAQAEDPNAALAAQFAQYQQTAAGAESTPREVSQVETDLAKVAESGDPAAIANFMNNLITNGQAS